MKIGIIFFCVVVLLAINPIWLLMTWIVSSPVVTNFIARPYQNPFFGSYLLIDRWSSFQGFDIRELFNYDRIVCILLLVVFLFRKDIKKIKYRKLDIPFLLFILSLLISSFYSDNLIHRIRVVIDTYGLCYVSYYLGKNAIDNDKLFKIFINSLLVLGSLLIVISLSEYFIYINVYLYRITGPFLYWENLGLALSIVFFVVIFKKILISYEYRKTIIFYNLLIILLLICIFLAQTRTIMGVVLAGLIFISIKGKDIINKNTIRKYTILGAICIIIITIMPSLLVNTSFYQHRLSKRTDEGRIETYKAASRMFLENPVFGIGLKDFQGNMLKYVDIKADNIKWSATGRAACHNSYLVVAAECGLLGLLPMFLMILNIVKALKEYFHISKEKIDKSWALIMGALTIVYFMSALTFDPFFEATLDNKIYYLCLGVTVGRFHKLTCNS